jgi:hypothetical protein
VKLPAAKQDSAAVAGAVAGEAALGNLGLLTGALIILTLGAIVVGDGNPGIALAPVLGASVLFAIWKAPLRVTALVLVFLALALENPIERPANGLWQSPLYTLGALFLANLNITIGIRALRFSGLDLLTGFLLLVLLYRRMAASPIDGRSQIATAAPLVSFGWIFLASASALWLYGMLRGGDFTHSLWQCQKLFYLAIMFLFMQAALRGPEDQLALGRVVILAACYKAALGLWVAFSVVPPTPDSLIYVTSHADSMLFACAFAIAVASFVHRPNRKNALLCAGVLPLIGIAMVVNHRRLVWVEVTAVVLLLYGMLPRTAFKRRVRQVAVAAVPLLILYAAIGWESQARIFRPVQLYRSVISSDVNRSSATRDIENFNLLWTLRGSPLLGIGFGHQYVELVHADDISGAFAQYRFIPHNSVLGLLAFCGVLGFSGIWMLLVVGIFFGARSYRSARMPEDRTAAFCSLAAIVIYMIQCYGDMGVVSWTGVFLVAPALAVVGKLAVASGAWQPKIGRSALVARPVLGRPVRLASSLPPHRRP